MNVNNYKSNVLWWSVHWFSPLRIPMGATVTKSKSGWNWTSKEFSPLPQKLTRDQNFYENKLFTIHWRHNVYIIIIIIVYYTLKAREIDAGVQERRTDQYWHQRNYQGDYGHHSHQTYQHQLNLTRCPNFNEFPNLAIADSGPWLHTQRSKIWSTGTAWIRSNQQGPRFWG